MKFTKNTIENNFMYHSPNAMQQESYKALRARGKSLANLILKHCPDSREKSLAITNLEQTIMWANASIARHEYLTK